MDEDPDVDDSVRCFGTVKRGDEAYVYGGWNEDDDWCVVNDAKEPASVSLLIHQRSFPYTDLIGLLKALSPLPSSVLLV
jgi:hypothetical protein